MDHRESLAAALFPTLQKLGAELSSEEIQNLIEVPRDTSHGDLAFPCFQLAKALRKGPPVIAQEVAAELELPAGVSAANAMGPYINFVLDRASLAADVIPAILDGSYLAPRPRVDEKVMVEYSQPNTHKALHVGHSRCAALGDALVRLFEWTGHETIAANYLGDEGTHVARCLWFYKNHFTGDVPDTNRGEFLGGLYAEAVQLVSLSALTKAPLPGVTAARVTSVEAHPTKETFTVVGLDAASGDRTVVCGGTGFAVGDLVAYAGPGTRVNDRPIAEREVAGVSSCGMICSGAELGINDENQAIAVLDSSVEIGSEVAEIFSTIDEPVLPLWQSRNDEVGQVLADIESGQGELHDLWKETRQWSIDDFMEHYRWLDCRFDHWFYESEFAESSKQLVRKFQDDGVFIESDGAIGADLSSDKLGFAILTKSNGTATYASRDLVLATKKFEEFGVDRSVYVVDEAQTLHFNQVFKCLERMGYKQAKGCHHHAYGRVVLADPDKPAGYRQISSRAGDATLFSELRNGLEQSVREKFLAGFEGEWPQEEIDTAADALGLAAIRYGMLRQSNDSMIVFDIGRWTEPKGETGTYLLYAYARIQSIKRKTGLEASGTADWSLLAHDTEGDLVGQLADYHSVVERAASEFSPNHLCSYAYTLCKGFSRFYRDCPIKAAESEELQLARISLADAVGRTLAHCLSLLGIRVIDRM